MPKKDDEPIDPNTFTPIAPADGTVVSDQPVASGNSAVPGIGISTTNVIPKKYPNNNNANPSISVGTINASDTSEDPVLSDTAKRSVPTFSLAAVNPPSPADAAASDEEGDLNSPAISVLAASADQSTNDANPQNLTAGELQAVVTVPATTADQPDNTAPSTNDDFIYPLSTKKFELNNFFNTDYRDSDAKQSINKQLHDYFQDFQNSPPYKLINERVAKQLIQKMPFDMYMRFRNYQMSQMQHQAGQQLNDLQKRLNLLIPTSPANTVNPDDFKDNSPWWEKFAPKWLNKLQGKQDPTETLKARIDYYKKLTALFKDVSMSPVPDDPKVPQDSKTYYIKRGIGDNQKTLVTIKEEENNKLSFKISSKLTEEEKKDAILIMLDQTTRQRERSASTQLTISGYLGNPKMALQIYQSALLQGSTPSISEATLAEWGRRSKDESLSEDEKRKYVQALIFHDKYQKIITDPKKRRNLRKLIAKQEFQQELNNEFKSVKDASDKAKEAKEKEQKSKDSNQKAEPTAPTDPAATAEPSPTVTPANNTHKGPR